MKKTFLSIKEITKEDIESRRISQLMYDRVKETASIRPLMLDGNGLKIGEEAYLVPNGAEVVVPVIIVGYCLSAVPFCYDEETGIVDTESTCVFMDGKGNMYYEHDYICVRDTYEEAEEVRKEMAENAD